MTSLVPVPRRWVVRLLGPVVGGAFFLALAAALAPPRARSGRRPHARPPGSRP